MNISGAVEKSSCVGDTEGVLSVLEGFLLGANTNFVAVSVA